MAFSKQRFVRDSFKGLSKVHEYCSIAGAFHRFLVKFHLFIDLLRAVLIYVDGIQSDMGIKQDREFHGEEKPRTPTYNVQYVDSLNTWATSLKTIRS